MLLSKKEKRRQNPRPKTRKPNPNPREENGKKRGKREKREGRASLNKYLIIVRQNAATMPGKAAGDGEIYKRKKWLHPLMFTLARTLPIYL